MKKVSIINFKTIQNNKGNIYKLLDRYSSNHVKGTIYKSN